MRTPRPSVGECPVRALLHLQGGSVPFREGAPPPPPTPKWAQVPPRVQPPPPKAGLTPLHNHLHNTRASPARGHTAGVWLSGPGPGGPHPQAGTPRSRRGRCQGRPRPRPRLPPCSPSTEPQSPSPQPGPGRKAYSSWTRGHGRLSMGAPHLSFSPACSAMARQTWEGLPLGGEPKTG